MLVNGRTAIDGLLGSASACGPEASLIRHGASEASNMLPKGGQPQIELRTNP